MNVLRVIGSSPRPLSTYQIFKQVHTKYAYEVIKDLHKNGFVMISYNEKTKNEIDMLDKQMGTTSVVDEFKIRSRTFSSFEEEQQIDRTIGRISSLSNEPKNWRYSLNFKGFLLYLIGYQNRKVNYKFTNIVIKNLKTSKEFDFLEYLDTFQDDVFTTFEKIDLLIEIAIELQFQLKTLTKEYLSYYLKRRLYDEITSDIVVKTNPILNTISMLGSKNKHEELKRQEKERKVVRQLVQSKISLLMDLISKEKFMLESMVIDLEKTKQSNPFDFHSA